VKTEFFGHSTIPNKKMFFYYYGPIQPRMSMIRAQWSPSCVQRSITDPAA